jgi:hypothetical protein
MRAIAKPRLAFDFLAQLLKHKLMTMMDLYKPEIAKNNNFSGQLRC